MFGTIILYDRIQFVLENPAERMTNVSFPGVNARYETTYFILSMRITT